MSRYQEVNGWAAAWDSPNEWHGLLAYHGIHYTRGEVWDSILENWFEQAGTVTIGATTDGAAIVKTRTVQMYFYHGKRDYAISRHSAIKALRKRGLRVVRVVLREKEPSENFLETELAGIP